MHAIVMAAGEGRRLRPLTERWPKPILPIDGRPVIATLLRGLAEAGFGSTTVVTGHLAEPLERLVGSGEAFGLEIDYVRQPRADGSADAVRRALAAGANAPALVTAADTVYAHGSLASFRERWAAEDTAGAVAYRRDPPPDPPDKPAIAVLNGRVTRVEDDDPTNPLGSAPLWAMGAQLVPYLDEIEGPPYELKTAFQRAIDEGLAISAIDVGPTRDLTNPLDLVAENFAYLER